MNQEFESAFSGLRVSHEVAVRMSAGLQSPEGLTWVGGSASNMGHSHDHWQEASVPHHSHLSPSTKPCDVSSQQLASTKVSNENQKWRRQ